MEIKRSKGKTKLVTDFECVSSTSSIVYFYSGNPVSDPGFHSFNEMDGDISLQHLPQSCVPLLIICFAEVKKYSNGALTRLRLKPVHDEVGQW